MVSVYQNSRLRATHLEWNPRNRELHLAYLGGYGWV